MNKMTKYQTPSTKEAPSTKQIPSPNDKVPNYLDIGNWVLIGHCDLVIGYLSERSER